MFLSFSRCCDRSAVGRVAADLGEGDRVLGAFASLDDQVDLVALHLGEDERVAHLVEVGKRLVDAEDGAAAGAVVGPVEGVAAVTLHPVSWDVGEHLGQGERCRGDEGESYSDDRGNAFHGMVPFGVSPRS